MKFDRIYVEIGNVCNLQCNFCPEVEREKKLMTPAFFRHVLNECKGLTEEVTMHVMGEPMNHPDFIEMVNICAEENMRVQLTTNGTLLREPLRREILFSPIIRQINFSLQSVTAQNFTGQPLTATDAQVRARYLQNIFRFTREAQARRPDLYINYRLWNIGSGEDDNRLFLDPIEKEFNFSLEAPAQRDLQPFAGFRKSHRVEGRLYLHFDSRFDWPTLNAPVRQTEGFCHALKSHIGILAEGTVIPCCLDKEAKLALGQISIDKKDTLKAILKSERAQKMRLGFDEGRVCEELCKRCQYIERFAKKAKKAQHNTSVNDLRTEPLNV